MRISDWSSDVCSSDLENAGAIAGLIACHLASGDVAGAREMFDGLDDKMRADPAFASVAAQLALQEQAADAGELPVRSTKRRVGKEGVSTCRSRWQPDH